MKRTITQLLLLTLMVASMSSCVSTNKGFQSSPVVARNIHLDPIKADINVDENKKLKGESSASYLLFFLLNGDRTYADGINYSTDASASIAQRLNPLKLAQAGRLNKICGAAAFKALNTGEYDVLVHPNYTTTIKNYLIFKKYMATVEGYGATYENFRTERQKIVILEEGKEIILQDR